jgi:hypothetical protein
VLVAQAGRIKPVLESKAKIIALRRPENRAEIYQTFRLGNLDARGEVHFL